MNNIIVKLKPASISFDEIHKVLWNANEVNRAKGFIMKTSILSGAELEKRIGDKGKCYIALDGEKIIGTISVRIVNRNKWYYKGELPNYMLAAVLPEYQGKGINSLLAEKVFEFCKENGYPCIELDTAEDNTHAIEVYKHQGFDLVDFQAKAGLDHYSVIMVKWFETCPYSILKRKLIYNLRRILVKAKYKKGKKRL